VTTEIELLWLDERDTVTLSELARVCGLAEQELHELVEYGAVAPVESGADPVFSAACVPGMRAAGRLRRDFDLDLFAIAMLLEHLDRIETLERRIAALEAELPHRQ
jgi:hypothetical protein